MAERIPVGVYPVREDAVAAAEAKLNELLAAGQHIIGPEFEETAEGHAVSVVYETVTPEEVAAEEAAVVAAGASAVAAGVGKGWAAVLAIVPLCVAIGGIVYVAIKRWGGDYHGK